MALIELRGIRREYTIGEIVVRALRGVDLAVERGEFLAVMGASGSGKTTLMNILGCLDRPTAGTYRLDGFNTASAGGDEFAGIRNAKIGFVFQGFNLLPRTTALENVELPLLYSRRKAHATPTAKKIKGRAAAALRAVGLDERLDHVPAQLSGGQQQRVAIARALVNEPVFILADEPTGNLDTEMSLEIMALFQELNERGITIVMVTHEPELALYTRRIVTMCDGAIISDKPVERRRSAATALAVWRERHAILQKPKGGAA